MKRGFTIVEMVVTVAIVGTITAVAVPGFLRIRTEANMESVRQNMRVIGEKMIEIFNNKHQFPEDSRWPLTNTTDPDELTVTASLSAINAKSYTINEYSTGSNRSTYQFCTSPTNNIFGTKRFCVNCDPQPSFLLAAVAPGQVAEIPQTQYISGIDSYIRSATPSTWSWNSWNYQAVLGGGNRAMRNSLQTFLTDYANQNGSSSYMRGADILAYASQSDAFMTEVRAAAMLLRNQGIHLYLMNQPSQYLWTIENGQYVQRLYAFYRVTAKYIRYE